MTTRCKFHCASVTKRSNRGDAENPVVFEATFNAVYGDSEENKQFFKWTPTGQLSLGVYKQDIFEPGKDYYLDITPCENAK